MCLCFAIYVSSPAATVRGYNELNNKYNEFNFWSHIIDVNRNEIEIEM